jgi:hypothetical protein
MKKITVEADSRDDQKSLKKQMRLFGLFKKEYEEARAFKMETARGEIDCVLNARN